MITLNNVYKEIKGKSILSDINLLFQDRGLYLIKGDNGAGKSSLLSIIGLVDNRYTGSLSFDNLDFKNDTFGRKRTKYRKEHISFLMAKNNLLSDLNVEDNLNYYSNKSFDVPLYNIDLKEKAKYLSGGEEQIIALIREIKSSKNIMLLDEITSFLDDAKTSWVLEQLSFLSKDRLVIFATHDERVFFPQARIIYLNDGFIEN